jgi:ferrochelatase
VSAPTGVLLVNLGTPDAPEPAAVRRYLREFLSDPRVLDISPVGRWALLELVILPLRPAKSAAAYRKIWSEDGSPLLVHSRALAREVAEKLPDGHRVELAMRYGSPSIDSALDKLVAAGCERLVLVPLYPQYASSSTGSSVEAVYRSAGRRWNTPFLTVVPPFYDDARFVEALAAVGRPVLDELEPDMVLMSYHGLPERHMVKSDPTGGHCLKSETCCDVVDDRNRSCYRAQCYATSRALARALDLSSDRYTVSFQSRLGRTPWIRPFTDEVLVELAKKGVQRLAVFCPAFVADCLETLEEIGIRAQEDFQRAGGKELRLVPGLNAHPAWVEAVVGLVRDACA